MRSYETREQGSETATSGEDAAAPGKTTRTQDASSPWAFDGAAWESAEGGQPLPGDLRSQFEASLGADLSGVRVHPGSSAATSIGAKAFAKGQDIHFAPGKYDPNSSEGRAL